MNICSKREVIGEGMDLPGRPGELQVTLRLLQEEGKKIRNVNEDIKLLGGSFK